MRERFQITDKKLNIFNILETIISPENSETNSVTQNQIACAIKKQVPAGRKKRGVEALQGKCFPLFVIKATRHKSYNNKALVFSLFYGSCRFLYLILLFLQGSVSRWLGQPARDILSHGVTTFTGAVRVGLTTMALHSPTCLIEFNGKKYYVKTTPSGSTYYLLFSNSINKWAVCDSLTNDVSKCILKSTDPEGEIGQLLSDPVGIRI